MGAGFEHRSKHSREGVASHDTVVLRCLVQNVVLWCLVQNVVLWCLFQNVVFGACFRGHEEPSG